MVITEVAELKKKINQTAVSQKDETDCGVASLLSLLKYYGGNTTLENLREISGTSVTGTTLLGLYQAANKVGFVAEGNEAHIQAIIEHDKPLILHVLIDDKLEHYIVCYGFINSSQKFLIFDPAIGTKELSIEELETIWKSKVCLTLQPTEELLSIENSNLSKRKWIQKLIEKDKKLLIFSLLLGLGIAIAGMALSLFSQKLIDEILPKKNYNKLTGGIVLLFILLIIRTFFLAIRENVLNIQTKKLNIRIADYFYNNLLYLPKSFFDNRKIGELTARLDDTNRIQRVIRHIVSNVVIDVLNVLVSLGFLYYYSWKVALFCTLILPFYFYLIYRKNKSIVLAQRDIMQSYAQSESNYIATMQGVSVIKLHHKQSIFSELNKKIFGNYQDKVFELGKINVKLSYIAGILTTCIIITILSYCSYAVLQNKMLLGECMALLGISAGLMPSVTNLALITIPIQEAQIAFDRMFDFTLLEKEKNGNVALEDFHSLEFNNVSFRFPGRALLLDDVTLKLNIGECVGIVGESGKGKSTLTQIIQQFYEPEAGEIIINNTHNLFHIKNEDWRNAIAVIPQDIHLFNGTILDNVILGSHYHEESFLEFIKKFDFQDFINTLPNGLLTIVGEEGINLSGGQKQLVAFMRALYKNPKLLILDEPTSAMDSNTEEFVSKILQTIKSHTAILLISHRIKILNQVANRIYNLQNKTLTPIPIKKTLT